MIALDVETYLFGPKNLAPKVVCASYAREGMSNVIGNGEFHLVDWLKGVLKGEQGHVVGHNIAYDLACIIATYPTLTSAVFTALNAGWIHDTLIREKLISLGTHGKIDVGPTGQRIKYSLAAVAHRRCGRLLTGKSGEDIWRLRYAELDGMKASEYPQEAYDYAKQDAEATLEVANAQERFDHLFRPESLHVKAAFCCYLLSAWGLEVDRGAKERLQAQVEAELTPEALPLLYETGIVIPPQGPQPYANGAKAHHDLCERKKPCECPVKLTQPKPERLAKKGALVPLIEHVCKKSGIDVKLTDKGGVATDSEWIGEIKHLHPALGEYAKRQALIKLITSYFPALEWPFGSGQTAEIIHPRYDALKKTGRVSSYGVTKKTKNPAYPAVNIQQADPRIREIYKPRDGWVYAVCDFTAIDLCSLAQTIKDLFGHSTLLDQINRGVDPHAFLGAVLAFEEDEEFAKEVRGLTDDQGYMAFMAREKTHPKWFKHWRTFAKPVGLGFPGGLGLRTMVKVCAGYGIRINEAEAGKLRRIWYQSYPEMKDYLRGWVTSRSQTNPPYFRKGKVQIGKAEVPEWEGGSGWYESPAGMFRVNCSYTELANGRALQTPAAEGFKEAMWQVVRACYDGSKHHILYGCRPVVNMHDELVVEVPDDEWAADRARTISELMIGGMQKVLPDVKISAKPLLTRRWVKAAKATYNEEGRLIPWETPTTIGV